VADTYETDVPPRLAQRWLLSRELRSAIRNPVLTRPFCAVTAESHVELRSRNQVTRQAVDRAYKVGNGVGCRMLARLQYDACSPRFADAPEFQARGGKTLCFALRKHALEDAITPHDQMKACSENMSSDQRIDSPLAGDMHQGRNVRQGPVARN
jgi:hypothetical protein